jgi:hypothetical protein
MKESHGEEGSGSRAGLLLPRLPKSARSPPLTRLQNRACVFRFTRLLGYVALVMSTFDRLILRGLDVMTMSMKEL